MDKEEHQPWLLLVELFLAWDPVLQSLPLFSRNWYLMQAVFSFQTIKKDQLPTKHFRIAAHISNQQQMSCYLVDSSLT
jgi:hypothetical protein